MTDAGQDPETGQFTFGNTLWRKSLNRFGRRGIVPQYQDDPDALLRDVEAYLADLEENPFQEQGIYGKDNTRMTLPKMRAPTIKGLCCHIGIHEATWRKWREERDDLTELIVFVDQLIWSMKFEGVAAGFLKEQIVLRELGLADKTAVVGADGGAVKIEAEWNDTEVARRLAFVLAKAMEQKGEQADED